MEERKLIRLGNSSFAIALPKDWIEKSGLKKGDKIFLEKNNNGEIIVSPQGKKSIAEKEISIETKGKDIKAIKRAIIDAYISGYTQLNLNGSISKNYEKSISSMISNLMSCEITKQSKDGITIKDFFNLEGLNINSFIKRMDTNLREMFEIAEKGFELKQNQKIMSELKEIDYNINKFYFFFSRIMTAGAENPSIINKIRAGPLLLFNYWWIAFHLEAIGDTIKNVAASLFKSQDKNLAEFFLKIKDFYLNSFDAFYSQDRQKAVELVDEGRKLFDELDKSIEKNSTENVIILDKLKHIEDHTYQIIKIVSFLKEKK